MAHSADAPRILIVDDLPGNLETLGEILHEHYRVLAASSGPQALTVAARDPAPELILLDIMMPGMDGFAVFAKLCENPATRDIPVLFVTALGDESDEERGLRLGAVDYLTKPLSPSLVLARVATQLELARTRRLLADQNRHLESMVAERTRDLEQARLAAEAASRAKSAFLANMSHELRTPLNIILGHAQTLERSPLLPAVERKSVEAIHRSGSHLLLMLEDMLDLIRIEGGGIETAAGPCDLLGFVHGIEEIYRSRAADRGLAFRCIEQCPLPTRIRIDERRLRRILEHLLDNAIKFTPAGEVRVEYSVKDSRLGIVVADTGPGIPPQRLERLFHPFQQDGNTLYSNQGMGVGLALSKGLTEQLGGNIRAENDATGGLRISLDLPLKVLRDTPSSTAASVTAPPITEEQPAEISTSLTPSQHALLIDLARRGKLQELRNEIQSMEESRDPLLTPVRQAVASFDIKRTRRLLEEFRGEFAGIAKSR